MPSTTTPRKGGYRKANRERPLIGDCRPPLPRGDIQPGYWLEEYTTELIDLLNVLGLVVDLEPVQAELLDKICSGPTISAEELVAAGTLASSAKPKKTKLRKRADFSRTRTEPWD